MAKKQATPAPQVEDTGRAPVYVKDEAEAMEVALSGIRRRPVLAIGEEGKLVVCTRTTAKRKGWEVQGKLYARIRSGKSGKASPQRRAADVPNSAALVAEVGKVAAHAAELVKAVLPPAHFITDAAAMVAPTPPAPKPGPAPKRRTADKA